MNNVNRILVGLVLLFSLVTLSAFWPEIPEVDKQTPLAAVMPPPSHIEWHQFPVGGFILVNPDPAVRDSLGNAPFLRIPEGAVLLIPKRVEGSS
jgi:hypothetical protein